MRWLIALSLTLAATVVLSDSAKADYAHAPYEMGECSVCHETDMPDNPGELTDEINELCFQCHDEVGEAVSSFENVHPPVEDGCTSCHDPHNSIQPKLLNAALTELCGECHDDIVETAQESPVQHNPVVNGDACLNCHDPHASNLGYMLAAQPYDLCIGCHGRDGLSDEAGRPLTNFKTLLSTSAMVHGPVDDEDCSACHQVHGGNNFRLLVGAYPEAFYAPYNPENYDLCFSCHDSDVFETPSTTSLTGFRDGDRNLHFVHVNKADRGRTCRACHEVHAAPQEHMIRAGVPYGSSGWTLKINYTSTENGGSCAKTCHPAKPYDRMAGRD